MLAAIPLLALALTAAPVERHFHIEQTYAVPAAALGGKSAVLYFPLPEDDAWQTITDLQVDGAPVEVLHDAAYGNSVARVAVPASGAELHLRFNVARRERAADLSRATAAPAPNGYARWLGSDRLVQVDDRVRKLAAEVTRGASTPLAKAQAIYAYVLKTMRYEKKGEGWGNGSIVWACDSKYGNCTDFHALLIGLLRASGIPARFQIGYPVPEGAGGEIAGYHCWADFYLEGAGWVPVDASEGWKNPAKRDYFFGHHDANRFALSMGRDIQLPGMKAATPLNYFVYPYAETADGQPVTGVTRKTSFTALPESGDAASARRQ